MWQEICVQERAGQNKDMVNINCINACDFQIINLKHNVKKKIKLGESQTQNAWFMTEDCKEWFSREGESTICSEND